MTVVRRECLDQMAATLELWSMQIIELQAKARSGSNELQFLISRQMAALQRQWNDYAVHMNKVVYTNEVEFAEMRKSTERMAVEFSKIHEQATSRFLC
jgi:hypothetical protein